MTQDPLDNPSASEKGAAAGNPSTPPRPDQTGPSGSPAKPDSKSTYDLAPVELPAGGPVGASGKPKAASGKPGIDEAGLLEGFDEDADFEADPEVEDARRSGGGANARPPAGTARSSAKPGSIARGSMPGASEPPGECFVEPGMGSSKVWLVVGGVLLVLAVVAAAITQKDHPVLASLLVLYNGFLHTGTGVAALGVGSVVAGKRLGPLDLATSRMFAAVAGLLLLTNCTINIFGTTPIEELVLGAIVYAAIVAGTFRFWGQTLATVASAHFLMWLIVKIGMEITQHIGRTPAATTPQ